MHLAYRHPIGKRKALSSKELPGDSRAYPGSIAGVGLWISRLGACLFPALSSVRIEKKSVMEAKSTQMESVI
jgi:hypothetical protein